jgi:hypothetical protein
VGAQQRFDPLAQGNVIPASPGQISCAFGSAEGHRGVKKGFCLASVWV